MTGVIMIVLLLAAAVAQSLAPPFVPLAGAKAESNCAKFARLSPPMVVNPPPA